MSRLLKLLVTGLVMMLTLTATIAVPALATTDPTRAAANWIAGQSASVEKPGEAADAALALAAAQDPAHQPQADALLAQIRAGGATVVAESPEAAAKFAIVAVAWGQDPRTLVPDVDLIATVRDGIADDGSFGAWPGPFASGLAAVALQRAGEPVPDALITHLLTYANADGGFGFGPGEASDADNTGMALLGLLTADTDVARAAADKAREWATTNQAADGSWAGYNAVNSTAVMGGALASGGQDQAGAIAFLTGAQADSGAFTSNGADDMLATTQATLLLAGVSYLDVTAAAAQATGSPTASVVPATTAPAAAPATTGSGDLVPWLAGGGVALLALVVAGMFLRRSRVAR